MAGYYGVPTSGLISVLTQESGDVGVDTLKVFGNGVPCSGCNAYNFQDPILGKDYSPLHKVSNLLWNCNNALNSGSVFSKDNFDQTACTGNPSPSCDPYPLRANLKGVDCTQFVLPLSQNGLIYYNDELSLIQSGQVFETYSPLGVPPSQRTQEILNSPVVFIADFTLLANGQPPPFQFQVGTTRHLSILATDNSQRWLYAWTDVFENVFNPAWVWVEVTPSSLSSVEDGSVYNIPVKVGDVVSFWSISTSVPHGLVLSDKNTSDSAASSVDAFFQVLSDTTVLQETEDERWVNVYGHPGWSVGPAYGGSYFTGVVNDNAAGTQLFFSDLVWGPYAMNGALVIAADNQN